MQTKNSTDSTVTKEKLKTFSLKVFEEQDLKELEDFQKICIFEGTTPTDQLFKQIRNFNQKNFPNKDLVTESELFEEIEKEGLATNKPLLLKYRKNGHLEDKDDFWWWTNKNGHIVYDREKVIAFLKERASNPKSRIK